MSMGLLELSGWRAGLRATDHAGVAYTRPTVENLEERTVMASPASLGQAAGGLVGAVGHQAASFLPIQITSVVAQTVDGATQLVAKGTIAGQAFTAPITLSTSPATTGDCPILNLHLGPIDLNVLGLQVKTSEICLNIDANSGSGKLLGNLLCGVSHALDGGTSLGDILGGLTNQQTKALTKGLTNVLNGALDAHTNPTNATVLPSSTTNILHLELGPVDLNLLGLEVHLDNCDGGPVTVDVNAVSGPGNLLGNLLGDLAHLADQLPNIPALDHLLAHLGQDLLRLERGLLHHGL